MTPRQTFAAELPVTRAAFDPAPYRRAVLYKGKWWVTILTINR